MAIKIPSSLPANERFALRVHWQVDGCWRWTGHLTPEGYAGPMGVDGAWMLPTHYALRLFRGIDVPVGMHVDHLCRFRSCVNPYHLEVVTPAENTSRRVVPSLFRESCSNGHPWATNTYTFTDPKTGKPARACRSCRAAASSRQNEKRRGARRRARCGS